MKNSKFQTFKGAVIASSVLLAASIHAADPQVEALLAKMRIAYRSTKSITYTTESKMGSNVYVSIFNFQSPTKIRMTIASSTDKNLIPGLVLSTDGINVSVSTATLPTKVVAKYTPDVFGSNIRGNLESICFFDWERQLSTAPGKNMEHSTFKISLNQDWKGKKWTVLEETAAKDKVVCRYFIDPKTSYIWRTVVKSLPGGSTDRDSDSYLTKLGGPASFDDFIHV